MTASDSSLYIGLMSGTSMDSIDAALVELAAGQCKLLESINIDIPAPLKRELESLCNPGDNEIDRMGAADRQLGRVFAEAVQQLLAVSATAAEQVRAIGSHGQTIRHRPNQGDSNFSLQIGDPNTIAELTGITTIADFRRRDIAAGGQGAPLAPAFHNAAFSADDCRRAIVNIGGMANVTLLDAAAPPLGFDTGPGNVLMDAWIQLHRQQACDIDGTWAASGRPVPELLERLLQHPYFGKAIPKSTGREEFNLGWLQQQLAAESHPQQDVQATLLELTANSIANDIRRQPETVDEIYICGGGAYNRRLMERLADLLAPATVDSTAALGVGPEWVEAAAFAWLAKQTLDGLPGNLRSVTGAGSEVILGAIYQA